MRSVFRAVVAAMLTSLALPLSITAADPLPFPTEPRAPNFTAPCIDGMANGFPCSNVDLLSFLPNDSIGGGRGSDVWGWQDPSNKREYALAGRETGTSFVDVTNPVQPLFLANLPSAGTGNPVIWRDIKVYADHAFVVAERPNHGMQVVDLRQLRDIKRSQAPATIGTVAHYTDFLRAHNIAINEDTGFAYAVGARNDIRACAGGLHMIDIRNPASPTFAGCFAADGYTHDTECVVYEGPDGRFAGREICVNSNEDTITIVDVTNKAAPVMLSRTPYGGSAYVHQGWFVDGQRYFLSNDELDELNFGHNTRTRVWDMASLTAPQLIGMYDGPTPSTDHNLYIKGNFVYESNYRAGLRILSLDNVAQGQLEEVAFFDVYPPNDDPGFSFGTWSNYPYFEDPDIVVVHGYQGMFVVRPRLGSGAAGTGG